MKERRTENADRRQRAEKLADRRQRAENLPVKDSDGCSVFLDRRYFPDRRKSHYDPNW
jgi:hypothetical protein